MAQSGKGRGARRGGLPGTALGLAALGVVAALVGAFVIGPMLQSKGDLKNGSHQLAAKPSSTTEPGYISLTTEPGKSGPTLDADDGQPDGSPTPATTTHAGGASGTGATGTKGSTKSTTSTGSTTPATDQGADGPDTTTGDTGLAATPSGQRP